jgi:hypothetical protein
LLSQGIALAVNAASAQSKWPGRLDFVRQNPWWFLGGTTLILAVLVLLDRFWGGSGATKSGSEQNANFQGATIHGSVTVSQGDGTTVASTPRPPTEHPDRPPPTTEPKSHHLILVHVFPQFLDATWERAILTTAKAVSPDAICLPLDDQNMNHPAATAIVIAFSSAHLDLLKRRIAPFLRSARASYPSTRTLVAAVGLSDAPMTDEDGQRLLRTAGYSLDRARFVNCPTEEAFQLRLASDLWVAVELQKNQTIVDQDRMNLPDQEIASE